MKAIYLFLLFVCISLSSKAYTTIYNVGTGSGTLTIDGSLTSYAAGSLIIIASGTYSYITIQNLSNETIENGNGEVDFSGTGTGLSFSNLTNDSITRNPWIATSCPYGFVHYNNTYRATSISGQNSNVVFQWVRYREIGDDNIYSSGTQITWANTDATVQDINIHFLNLRFDSCGGSPFQITGTLTTSVIAGLWKNIEFGNIIFIYSDAGDLCYAQPISHYNVHNCSFISCNPFNNDDNGLFHMIGTGNFNYNYAKDCQGHMIRMWTITIGTTPVWDTVFGNIYTGSRKYSQFEWQSTVGDNIPVAPGTTYTNVLMCNNTAGDLNYIQDGSFDAVLVENYGMPTGAQEIVFNNALYNTYAPNKGPRFFQFQPINPAETDSSRDWYFSNSALAGFDTVANYLIPGSPLYNAGAPGYLAFPTDFNGYNFNASTPSIGAVQTTGPVIPTTPNSFPRHHRKLIIQ